MINAMIIAFLCLFTGTTRSKSKSEWYMVKTEGEGGKSGDEYLIELEDYDSKGKYSEVITEESKEDKYSDEVKEKGWTKNMYGHFKVMDEECKDGCTFNEAAEICSELNATLPIIHNLEENQEVQTILEDKVVWLSMHSQFLKGIWQLHNTLISAKYFNFDDKSSDDDGRCSTLGGKGDGKWEKTDCESTSNKKEDRITVLCYKAPPAELDSKGRPKMGVSECDDGKKLIKNDLKTEEEESTCKAGGYKKKDKPLKLKKGKNSEEEKCTEVPKGYVPNHICINETVLYPEELYGRIPSFGPHRPNWAKFGEYSYCPPERYQHNIEHGCVVMLYHPCLDKKQVKTVKSVLSSCIRKQVITPSRLPTPEKPLVFIAWGCVLELDALDMKAIDEFIVKRSYLGPEGHFPKDGLYDHKLVAAAKKKDDYKNKPKTCLKKKDGYRF